eukprot:1681376-Lingulodinium_polyedra.AAC.1
MVRASSRHNDTSATWNCASMRDNEDHPSSSACARTCSGVISAVCPWLECCFTLLELRTQPRGER